MAHARLLTARLRRHRSPSWFGEGKTVLDGAVAGQDAPRGHLNRRGRGAKRPGPITIFHSGAQRQVGAPPDWRDLGE
jgi:hypothetical protein